MDFFRNNLCLEHFSKQVYPFLLQLLEIFKVNTKIQYEF
jgi:hypothetical protein